MPFELVYREPFPPVEESGQATGGTDAAPRVTPATGRWEVTVADPLRDAVASIVRDLVSTNDVTRWRRIEAEAIRRGFTSTRAFRTWCLARAVPLREDNHRDTWVEPAAVDAAVERMPNVSVRRTRTADNLDLDNEINSPPASGRSAR